ncbi:O-antigen ligase family protein [Paraburkholderia sp. MMS20-SJTN17]|uniref:O-antigen ligase family protein n=1 Tax=Paraburkholderia translucens TaxID=2886945 RepID=A0ABS8KDJ9_9BURK|nr:O-antigen ligase family protein [Paraburkholderia sp. MMS20-SJTN17]MCC8402846.1 O-antigen ligase family protein [Paraburkholderia sp. MMS20-SJTN17]
MVLIMLTCRHFWVSAGAIRHNAVAVTASILFLLMCMSLLWDVAPIGESIQILAKYRKLLYFPFLLILFNEAAWRRLAIIALYISLTLVLVLSCSNWLGLTQIGPLYAPDPIRASWVFKHHITQGLFTALLAYMALTLACGRHFGKKLNIGLGVRVSSAAITVLALVSILVMQEGRTAQAVLPPLLVLWCWQAILRGQRLQFGKAILLLGVAAVVFGLAVEYVAHDKIPRLTEVGNEIRDYEKRDEPTSVGLRLEFYRRSLFLISQRPIFGAGVGSVGPMFRKLASGQQGAQGMQSSNPHSEYFLISDQLGIVGLVVFLVLLWKIWRQSCNLRTLEGAFSAAYVAAFGIACLANSLLLDFPEGHMLVFLCGILLAPPLTRDSAPQTAASESI